MKFLENIFNSKWKWISCCVDCEGTITMNYKKKYRKINCYIAFSNDDLNLAKLFGKEIGVGKLFTHKNNTGRHLKTIHYRWVIYKADEQILVLPKLIPHLITIKKERARILLSFARSRVKRRLKSPGIYKSKIPYSKEEYILFEEMRKTYKESL